MSNLSIMVNDQLAYEYDRSTKLDEKQLAFLDKMDSDMDRGFRIHGELISKPDRKQKSAFVAMNLLKALKQQDPAKIAVSCAYLVNRLPHAIELHAKDQDGRISIEFIDEH